MAAIVALAATAVLLALAITAHHRLGRGWLARRTAERVIVHTTEGQTIEGLARQVTADGIVLAAARLVDHEIDMAGDVWIPKAKVLMVQKPPAA